MKPFSHKPLASFTLVETVIALGVFIFAIVTVVGLLATGLGMDRTIVQETLAIQLIELIDTDLRQASPLENKGKFFKVQTPYINDADGMVDLFSRVSPVPERVTETLFLSSSGAEVGEENARFRMAWTYVSGPGVAGEPITSLHPLVARLTLSWPASAPQTSNMEKVTTLVSFPSP